MERVDARPETAARGIGRVPRRTVAVVTGIAAIGLVPGLPAAAAPPEHPHGVGVCMSQVAVEPGIAGVERLGQLAVTGAGPGARGSGIPTALDDFRGDGPGGCGAPPGPGHLP